MIYLSGHVCPDIQDIGFILTPQMGNRLPAGRVWGADNGRFSDPEAYDDDAYLRWLSQRDPSLCLFATAPDVLCDHEATLALSIPMFPLIRALGYPAAFVAQNGFDRAPWDEFDCLFIGGDNKFKLSQETATVVQEARQRRKHVHMGRVNSFTRLRYAQSIGCDSADGTFLKFGPSINRPRLERWIENLRHPYLDFYPSGRKDEDSCGLLAR